MFVSMPIDNLLLKAGLLVPRADIRAILGVDCISTDDAIPFVGVELLNGFFLFLLDPCLVLCL